MRLPTPGEKLLQRLVVLPAMLVALAGLGVLLYSAVSWLLPVGRLVTALPDSVFDLLMLVGGLLVAIVVGKFSKPTSGIPEPHGGDPR